MSLIGTCGHRLEDLVDQIAGTDDDVVYCSPTSGRPLRRKIQRRPGNTVIIYTSNDRYGYKGAILAQFDGQQWCVKDDTFDQSGEATKFDVVGTLIESAGQRK